MSNNCASCGILLTVTNISFCCFHCRVVALAQIFKAAQCKSCGLYASAKTKLIYGPNPYRHELYEDEKPEFLCSDCYRESIMDV